MDTVTLIAPDDTAIPLYWAPTPHPRATLLLQPALGIQARLYRQLAGELAQAGCATAILEQRGHGLSKLQPGYRSNFSFRESLDQDIPAALQWLRAQTPHVPRLLGGHSLGGHLSTIYAGQHADELDGVVHLACAFPYIKDYTGGRRKLLRMLCSLIPLFAFFPGYYPGNRLGFGGRESVAMMKQWRQWALTGEFDFDERRGLAEATAAYTGPVLSIAFERDDFSTTAAIDRALSPFTSARVERVLLGEKEQGEHLGHTAWARQPDGVSRAIANWLDTIAVPA